MRTAERGGIVLRGAQPADHARILALNRISEAVLSPLAPQGLDALIAQSWHHRVACRDGEVQAFLIALAPGADYDSPNYRWFMQHLADFVYIDRVVVDATARQAGLASLLYDDLIDRALSEGIARITCEIDIEPPNPASFRFHARRGFLEVGTQLVAGGRKRVSLQALELGPTGAPPLAATDSTRG